MKHREAIMSGAYDNYDNIHKVKNNAKKGIRLMNSGNGVEEWCEATGNGSSTVDLCEDCADDMLYQDTPEDWVYGYREPVGQLEWSGMDPEYNESGYSCEVCLADLKE